MFDFEGAWDIQHTDSEGKSGDITLSLSFFVKKWDLFPL